MGVRAVYIHLVYKLHCAAYYWERLTFQHSGGYAEYIYKYTATKRVDTMIAVLENKKQDIGFRTTATKEWTL